MPPQYYGYSPATDTTELPAALLGLTQFLPPPPADVLRRHTIARRARKAGRTAFTTLAAFGAATLVTVTVWGPDALLDLADQAMAR